MKEIGLYVYPYWDEDEIKTYMSVNGRYLTYSSSKLTKYVIQQEMKTWLYPYRKGLLYWEGILKELVYELGDDEIKINFYGRNCDYQLFYTVISSQKNELDREGTQIMLETAFYEWWDAVKAKAMIKNCIGILKSNVISKREELTKLYSVEDMLNIAVINACFQTKPCESVEQIFREEECRLDPTGLKCIYPDSTQTAARQLKYIEASAECRDGQYLIFCLPLKGLQGQEDYGVIEAKYSGSNNTRCFCCKTLHDSIQIIKDCYEDIFMPGLITQSRRMIREISAAIPDYDKNAFILQIFDELDSIAALPFQK